MQYYELTLQHNTSSPDIRDYEKYITEIKDLWDIEIFYCLEYGPIHKKLHLHALCVREDTLHPLRRCNMPIKKGWSISFCKVKSRFAWETYYSKNIEYQNDIHEYEYNKRARKMCSIL